MAMFRKEDQKNVFTRNINLNHNYEICKKNVSNATFVQETDRQPKRKIAKH